MWYGDGVNKLRQKVNELLFFAFMSFATNERKALPTPLVAKTRSDEPGSGAQKVNT